MIHNLTTSTTHATSVYHNHCSLYFIWSILGYAKDGSLEAKAVGKGEFIVTDLALKSGVRKLWILDWCYMCKCSGGSVDNLLLHCPITFQLWSMVFTLFSLYWVMPKSVVDLLACWQGKFGCYCNNIPWMAVTPCLMWCIWWEQNNWCFEDFERTVIDLKPSLISALTYVAIAFLAVTIS